MKKFFITVLSLMMILTLGACGAKPADEGSAVAADAGPKEKLFAFMTAQNDIAYDDVEVTGGGSEVYDGEEYGYDVSYVRNKKGNYSFSISSDDYKIIGMTELDGKVYTEFLGMKIVEDVTPETEALNIGGSLRKMSQVSEEGLDVYVKNIEAETDENGETTIRFDLTEEGIKYLKSTIAVDDMIGLSENISDNSKVTMEIVHLADMTVKKIYINCDNKTSGTDKTAEAAETAEATENTEAAESAESAETAEVIKNINLTLNFDKINGNNEVSLSEPASSYVPWSEYEDAMGGLDIDNATEIGNNESENSLDPVVGGIGEGATADEAEAAPESEAGEGN